MIIKYLKTGGFAGLHIERIVDTAKLTAAEQQELNTMLATTGILTKTLQSKRGHGFDMFNYTIIVEDEGQKYEVSLDDGTKPQSLNPLITFIEQKGAK
jgi:hypothetical protein